MLTDLREGETSKPKMVTDSQTVTVFVLVIENKLLFHTEMLLDAEYMPNTDV